MLYASRPTNIPEYMCEAAKVELISTIDSIQMSLTKTAETIGSLDGSVPKFYPESSPKY